MSFGELASRFEQRFGKGTLRAASKVEFNVMTKGSEESLEQWGDRVILLNKKSPETIKNPEETLSGTEKTLRDPEVGTDSTDETLRGLY